MPGAATQSCFDPATPMLELDEAVARLRDRARTLEGTENAGLAAAAGRVLAADVTSPIDVPGFDNSAMDGYALHSEDMARACSDGLAVGQRIPAGQVGAALPRGQAARIFTGAPVPAGADTVVMQEDCRVRDGQLVVDRAIPAGANIRPRGNSIQAGSILLEAGTPLQAAHVGLAASVGLATLEVRRRPRVAILVSGDELVEPGRPLAPGQIYNSNRYQLGALLAMQGCEVIDLGTIPDDFEQTREALLAAAGQADLVISSGGVSVGEEDHVRAALEAVGELDLWRVRMKPGKPLAFGHIGAVPFLGLPGNPVSVYVTFLLFARPFLQRLQGCRDMAMAACQVMAGFDFHGGKRREFLRVRLRDDPETGPVAEAYGRQGSDVLASVAWADGLVDVPVDAEIRAGQPVRFLPFPGWAR